MEVRSALALVRTSSNRSAQYTCLGDDQQRQVEAVHQQLRDGVLHKGHGARHVPLHQDPVQALVHYLQVEGGMDAQRRGQMKVT